MPQVTRMASARASSRVCQAVRPAPTGALLGRVGMGGRPLLPLCCHSDSMCFARIEGSATECIVPIN